MDKKSGAPMVKLFEDKMGSREAEVVLDDPRSTAGIVNWYNGMKVITTSIIFPALKRVSLGFLRVWEDLSTFYHIAAAL